MAKTYRRGFGDKFDRKARRQGSRPSSNEQRDFSRQRDGNVQNYDLRRIKEQQ